MATRSADRRGLLSLDTHLAGLSARHAYRVQTLCWRPNARRRGETHGQPCEGCARQERCLAAEVHLYPKRPQTQSILRCRGGGATSLPQPQPQPMTVGPCSRSHDVQSIPVPERDVKSGDRRAVGTGAPSQPGGRTDRQARMPRCALACPQTAASASSTYFERWSHFLPPASCLRYPSRAVISPASSPSARRQAFRPWVRADSEGVP